MMSGAPLTAIQIPCCLCGTMILPNAANQCGACLAQQFDLKSELQRGPGGSDEILVRQCRKCRRFEQSEKHYQHMELESPPLLALCLKKIPALDRMKLVDALWVWTEPNSMRLRIRLTVRVEVADKVMVQQRVPVELKIKFSQCPDCNREYTNRTWHAVLQLRQKRPDERKGLLLMEAALARNPNVRKHVLSMDISRHGFDFYFLQLSDAQAFASYLSRIAPMRIKTSQKLVSTDARNNTANIKHSVSCDMVPLCRDDLILINKLHATGKLAGRLCLVSKVSSAVHLIDAAPSRTVSVPTDELGPEKYYKSGGDKAFRVMLSPKRMTRFIVLDVDIYRQDNSNNNHNDWTLYRGPQSGISKYAIADVEVARESDMGHSDETFRCVTHLGNLLQVGDVVLGYDIVNAVASGGEEWLVDQQHTGGGFNSSFDMPDVVLVKKAKATTTTTTMDHHHDDQDKTLRVSKKKERRQRKHDKKQRNLEEAAARMGFLQDDDTLAAERQEFEKQLELDTDLARELEMAEQDLEP